MIHYRNTQIVLPTKYIRLKVSSNHFDPELFSANDEQTLKTNLGITPEDFVFIRSFGRRQRN
jgi:hypothetical protein